MTETLTSTEAAELLGVNAQKFHRLVQKHRIEPALAAPGLRGAKFWHRSDIETLRKAAA